MSTPDEGFPDPPDGEEGERDRYEGDDAEPDSEWAARLRQHYDHTDLSPEIERATWEGGKARERNEQDDDWTRWAPLPRDDEFQVLVFYGVLVGGTAVLALALVVLVIRKLVRR